MSPPSAPSSSPTLRRLRGSLLREAITLLLFSSLLLQSATAVAPDWWSTRGVLKTGATVDDYAVANVGQLKNLVRAAAEEMNDKLMDGAGDQVSAMLDAWRAQSGNNADDYAAVTVGQLKAVSVPLYQKLQDAGMPLPMPWTETTADDDDYALATIGQAKRVFSFIVPDIISLGTVDSDGDGFSDAVELAMGSNPNSASSLPSTVATSNNGSGGGGSTGLINGTSSTAQAVLVGESKWLYRSRDGFRGNQTPTNHYKQKTWDWDLYDTNVAGSRRIGSRTWTYDPTTGGTDLGVGDDQSVLNEYPLIFDASSVRSDTVRKTDDYEFVVEELEFPESQVDYLTETLSQSYTQTDLINGVNADMPGFTNNFAQYWGASGPVAKYSKLLVDDGVSQSDSYGYTKCQYKWQFQSGDNGAKLPIVWTQTFIPTPAGSGVPEVTPMCWTPGATDTESPVYTIDPLQDQRNGYYALFQVYPDLDVYGMWDGVPNYVLDDVYEDAVGAFVPLNDDDDDANGTPDFQQTGPSARVPGGHWNNGVWVDSNNGIATDTTDTDLLPIVVRGSAGMSGNMSFRLDIPSGLNVWRNPDRSDQVTSTTDIAGGPDTPLFVEGCQAGTYILNMGLVDSNGALKYSAVDSIKITVFQWKGPENVPGYSIHEYTVTGAPATAKWFRPDNGTIDSGWNTTDAKIRWQPGPAVGLARLYVNADYTWPLEVNVVEVSFATTSSVTPSKSLGALVYSGPPSQDSYDRNVIHSVRTPPAMASEITVKEVHGPIVGNTGSERGVDKLEMGFVQIGYTEKKRGVFGTLAPPNQWVSSLESRGDFKFDTSSNSPVPWYDKNAKNGYLDLSQVGSSNVSSLFPLQFEINDTPISTAVDSILHEDANFKWGSPTQYMVHLVFRLYFVVATKDSPGVYTERAQASWEFDGSGDVKADGGVGSTIGVPRWTQTGSGTTGSSSFTEVISGLAVSDYGQDTMNDLSRQQKFNNQ